MRTAETATWLAHWDRAPKQDNAMPKGPKGQKRPADVIGNAVKVMRIATGEEQEDIARRRRQGPGRQVAGAAGAGRRGLRR